MLVRHTYRPLFPEFGRVFNTINRDFDQLFNTPTVSDAFSWEISEDAAVVSADLPGLSADALSVTLDNSVLTIKGERNATTENDDTSYIRRERTYGSLTRSWKLPFTVDADNIVASYENGVLRVTLPKVEAEKPRQIAIQSA